jgi:hypothetical protein
MEKTGSQKSYDTVPFKATEIVKAALEVCKCLWSKWHSVLCNGTIFPKTATKGFSGFLAVDFTVLTQDKLGTGMRGLLLPSAQTKSALSKFTKRRELTIRKKT